MGIGKRIKEARLNLGLTQEELSQLLGITKGAVANYENETSHPKEPIMYKLIEVLKVDANYLFQDVVNIPKKINDVTFAEYEHIKKYRALDSLSKEIVDFVLEKELERNKTTSENEDSEYIELVARGGKYRVKKADAIEWAKQLDLDNYEEDHDLG